MTPEQLDAIDARAKAAAPGPWRVIEEGGWSHGFSCTWVASEGVAKTGTDDFDVCTIHTSPGQGGLKTAWEDAKFIAAARCDVPALVEEVRRLRLVLAAIAEDGCAHGFKGIKVAVCTCHPCIARRALGAA